MKENKENKKIISVKYQIKPKTHIIQGRTVNQRNLYRINKSKGDIKSPKSFISNGFVWFGIENINSISHENINVYNFDVEEDHSYIVENLAVHNCHHQCQFYISEGKYIDCMLNLRSSDLFLGLPFNIASYAILTYMIGHLTSYQPNRLIVITGDTHIYLNHLEQVKRQLMRTPYPFPSLEFRNRNNIHTIDDFKLENFMVKGYISHAAITAQMAI